MVGGKKALRRPAEATQPQALPPQYTHPGKGMVSWTALKEPLIYSPKVNKAQGPGKYLLRAPNIIVSTKLHRS